MAFAKRIVLFLVTNMLILVTVSFVFNIVSYVLFRGQAIPQNYYTTLMVWCVIWGFGGAFISLAMSRMMAKWMMGVKVIDPRTSEPELRWLVDTVYSQARAVGLSAMPEVGIWDSYENNAFATGPTKNRSLVAVSTGLLRNMNREQVEGVLAHEISHVANGDMVTMTIIQGVVNAFVMFFARIISSIISQQFEERSRYAIRFGLVFLFEIVFGILGSMVVFWFSRRREFRADAGGARVAGRQKMISALRALQRTVDRTDNSQPALQTLKISAGRGSGIAALFMSHPPLEERIRRLEMAPL